MAEAYLVGGVRTPVGRYGGALASVRPDDLAALVVGELVRRAELDLAGELGGIDEVILGAANQAGEDNRNVARMAVLLAGLPDEVPGITVNRLCASGMSAITMAAQAIRAGDADLIVAGGVESMTRAPWVQAKPEKAWARPGATHDTSIGWRFPNPELLARDKATYSMPETAEEVARIDGITREEADAFALRSQQRAVSAIAAGRFEAEIVGVPTARGEVLVDEGPRPETTLEVLAGLRPVVHGGSVVTAGNSSALNDGASAILVASGAAVERYGLTPRARVVVGTSSGRRPLCLPRVERALGYVQHTTQQGDRVVRLLLRDEPVPAHRVGPLVKKAMAFARTSRSSRTTRNSRRTWDNSSRSAVVRPSRRPASISAWASQRCTLLSDRPMSRQTSAIDLPDWRTSATVSALNSLVNLRLERLSIQTDSIGASIPRFQVSVEAGQVQTCNVNCSASGRRSTPACATRISRTTRRESCAR